MLSSVVGVTLVTLGSYVNTYLGTIHFWRSAAMGTGHLAKYGMTTTVTADMITIHGRGSAIVQVMLTDPLTGAPTDLTGASLVYEIDGASVSNGLVTVDPERPSTATIHITSAVVGKLSTTAFQFVLLDVTDPLNRIAIWAPQIRNWGFKGDPDGFAG